MAKAHLQNVHSRIEELQSQKKIIEEEIGQLSLYISRGLQEITELEEDQTVVDVSNK